MFLKLTPFLMSDTKDRIYFNMFYVISQVLFRFPGIYRLFLNCKIKIHPYFCVSGIYFFIYPKKLAI